MSERPWAAWVGLAARLVAAGIWLAAGILKAEDFTAFQAQVQAYDVLPDSLVAWVGYGVPLLEIGLGAYLLLGLLIRPAAVLSLALMLVFIAAEVQAWARGLVLDCGCFGRVDLQRVGPLTVLRDIGLTVPTLLVLAFGGDRWSLDGRSARPVAADQHRDADAVRPDARHDDLG